MSDKPCTHCGGSGTEPDPISDAWKAWEAALGQLPMGAGLTLARAAGVYRDQSAARITFLEAALRDILSRFREQRYPGTHQMLQVPNEDLRGWRVVLDGIEVNPASSYPGGVKPEQTCPGGC